MTYQALRWLLPAIVPKTTALFFGVLFGLAGAGFCQIADGPAFSTSALRPPSKVRWSIAYHSRDKASVPAEKAGEGTLEAPVVPVKAEYLLDQSLGRAVITYEGGGEKVIYLVDGLTLSRDAASGRIMTAVFGPYTEADGWFGKYYPGFSWVDKKFFVNVENIDGVECHHFKYVPAQRSDRASVDGLAFDPANPEAECEAWVEVKTKRPYLFRQGNLLGQYRFESDAGAAVTLPQEFQKAMRVYYGYSE